MNSKKKARTSLFFGKNNLYLILQIFISFLRTQKITNILIFNMYLFTIVAMRRLRKRSNDIILWGSILNF